MPEQDVLWNTKEFREFLRRSKAAFERDLAAGRVPKPMRIGRSLRWSRADVLHWAEAGMPTAKEWESRKKTQKR